MTSLDNGHGARGSRDQRPALIVLALLLFGAAALYSWNAYTLTAFIGYDAKGHTQYIATVIDEGRLPQPFEGWSSFHPPLYYLLGGLVSWPGRPVWNPLALRGISVLSILVAGFVSFGLVLRLGSGLPVAAVATALVLFVPCSLLAATSVGNEALGAGLAALTLVAVLKLQEDVRSLRTAALVGLLGGLALANKFTGIYVAVACVVPFIRLRYDRRMLGALALCAFLAASIAGPVYLRNIQLTGSPIPMTRERAPVKTAESKYVIRQRRVTDYLWINPAVLLRPSIHHVKGQPANKNNRNPAMTNVWGLTYASAWYDSFGHRTQVQFHRDGFYAGPLLTLLGIVPTTLVLAGFIAALLALLRRRSGGHEVPLVLMSLVGLGSFAAFTWRAPTLTAVKASYLLPLLVPAAVFFARGALLLGRRLRVVALVISAAAALAGAAIFTNGLVFPFETLEYEVQSRSGDAPGLAIVEETLRRSAHGRWAKVERPLIVQGGRIVWRLVAHEFPDANETATAAWCLYVADLMQLQLPERTWLVLIGQNGRIIRSCNERNWRSIQHPFLKAGARR